jgi:hypothetical protein
MNNKKEIILAIALIAFSIIFRVLNTTNSFFNFTPMIALSLFAGSIFSNKKLAYALPIIAMLFSDLFLQLFTKIPGFYGMSQVVNYAALVLVAILGTTLKNRNAINVLGYTLTSSLLFFVVSNFGVWFFDTYKMYSFSAAGFSSCFAAGLAFYKQQINAHIFANPLVGDIYFSVIFFGTYALSKVSIGQKATA